MKRYFLFFCLMVSALFAASQTRVSFTGVSLDGSYCPFDKVNVTNITRGWNETLVYPDTVLVLSGLGVEELSSEREGIIHVYPNPFEDFTNVEFGIFESGQVDIRVIGVDGMQKASWEGYMQAGIHQVRITLEKPQMAFVVVTTEKERYVGKLLHVGNNSVNGIDLCSVSPLVSGRSNGSNRSGVGGGFMPGDTMSYEGVLLNCVGEVYSDKVIQEQFGDETISLAFPVNEYGGEVRYLPYFQSFDSEFGTYTTFDVLGPQSWMIDYNTAKMTGYSGGSYFVNDDWLISSPVSLTGVSDAKMTIKYIGRYFHNFNEELTIWASMDYAFCSNPLTANWTRLSASLSASSNWSDFETTEVALTEFVGQTVTFAVRYTSTDGNAGTIEIQSILIEEGTAGGGPNPPGPGVEIQSLPYYQSFDSEFGTYTTFDVLGAQTWEIDYNTAKMTGYEGGSYYSNIDWLISSPVAITGVSDAKMTMSYIGRYFNNINDEVTIWASNDYILGDNPMNATWTRVSASLTEGSNWTDFQTTEIALTEFVGQTVTFAVKYTSTDSKAGTIEIQSILIEKGTAGGGPTPPGPGGEVQYLPYCQTFEYDFGTYTTYDAMGPQSWTIDYNTACMTGYFGGTYYSNEDWLVSSPVAITDVSDAKMTMKYVARYFNNLYGSVTILASADYTWGNNPINATWTQVPAILMEGNNWTDFQTAEISLTQFVGQIVTLAVKYTSSDSGAGTIEIQSICIEEGTAGGGPTPPGPGGELQTLPYYQSFATEFGTYTTFDVLGPQSWMIDYQTAKMTGYSGGSHANEDWLISSPVALTGVENAKVSVAYCAQYQNADDMDVTLQISTDYVYGSNPTTANWTQMSTEYPNTSSFSNFQTVETSLNDFIGQNVYVAIKYTSTDAQSRTIEIQSITIEEGIVGGGSTPPGPGAGSGTAADPYNVAAGIGLQSEEPIAWVQGYIVGAVKAGLTSVNSNNDINWNAPFDLVTNVVIADDPACHEISQCIIVNLPAGKPMRAAVNLVDHPENLGKQLAALGKLRKYFGQAGLRDSGGTENDFVLEGGDTPPPTPTTIFSETFASGQGDFTIQDVVLPQNLSYVWEHNSSYHCMKASSYVSQAYAAESWLVSPSIDLSDVSAAKLMFDQAVNYASPQGALKVMISTNYNGDVTTATWTELDLDAWPSGSNWTFINSTADLTNYVGQAVTVAFKYTSTTSVSATWEVKNFVVE